MSPYILRKRNETLGTTPCGRTTQRPVSTAFGGHMSIYKKLDTNQNPRKCPWNSSWNSFLEPISAISWIFFVRHRRSISSNPEAANGLAGFPDDAFFPNFWKIDPDSAMEKNEFSQFLFIFRNEFLGVQSIRNETWARNVFSRKTGLLLVKTIAIVIVGEIFRPCLITPRSLLISTHTVDQLNYL